MTNSYHNLGTVADFVEILRLRAENEKLRAALKPFADIYSDTIAHEEAKWKDSHNLWQSGVSTLITAGNLRAAAKALKETGDDRLLQ